MAEVSLSNCCCQDNLSNICLYFWRCFSKMIPTLSICIPTINRPELLLQSLNSIFCEKLLLHQLEVCISNNCSESDYQAVEVLLNTYANQSSIKYVRHKKRLSLDENHHFVKRMATSEYIYFLGDDDFFLRDELGKLINLIQHTCPDLAIFNGFQVNDENAYLGRHFLLDTCDYVSVIKAYRDLKDKCSFGAVLARKNILLDDDFINLYQTDHAYNCFWLSLFRKHERGEHVKIVVPDFPCVALRSGQKTYNLIDVHFKKIPNAMAVYKLLLTSSSLRYLIDEHAAEKKKFIALLQLLIYLRVAGYDLQTINKADPIYYDRYWFIIWIVQSRLTALLYVFLRFIYRSFFKKKKSSDLIINATDISYKLSLSSNKSLNLKI